MKKFRKGDVVSIECVVQNQYSEAELIVLQPNGYSTILIDTDKVKLVRHDIQIGDLVKNSGCYGKSEGRVIAIHADLIWVETSGGTYSTWKMSTCERVEISQGEVAP